MAINRLTDIVAAMKSKWTYGDRDFAYNFEVNEKHNTEYPYMMINPPNSEMPEIYGGWESYDFEISFFDTYKTATQQAVTLEQKWDNLQDLALEWFDNLMIHYNNPGGANVGIYFLEETIDFERVKEVANDRLVQIKMFFTLRSVTRCLMGNVPMNYYPNQIPNLALWLKADSGVEYDTPTKRVSAWKDQSGNNNNTSQSTVSNQPLRYNYDGAADKTRINFDGTNDDMSSDSNSPITNDVTIFTVAQSNPVTPPFSNKYSIHLDGGVDVVTAGNPAGGTGGQLYSFTDGANNDQPFSVSCWGNVDPTEPWRGWMEKLETGQKEYYLKPSYSSGYIEFRVFDNATGGSLLARVTTFASAQKGSWHHYVGTYDGSGLASGLKIYIDGVESQDTQNGTGVYNGMQLTTSNLDLGNGNSNSYVGDIDECSIYDKALSTAEIVEMFNLGNPNDLTTLSSSSANLIGWWRMGDGATYPTIPDVSTNSNDATMLDMTADNIRAYAPNSESSTYFNYEYNDVRLNLGSSSERLYCQVADDSQGYGEWNARNIWDGDTSKYHIATMSIDSTTTKLKLQYNNATSIEGTMSTYNVNQTYNQAKFKIGDGTHLGRLDGNIQEIIIYNRVLTSLEQEYVRNYLNNKYKIY